MTFQEDPGTFSHSTESEEIFAKINNAIKEDKRADMTSLFLQHCSHTWIEHLKTPIEAVLRGPVSEEATDEMDAVDLVCYHWEVAQLVDSLVYYLYLPIPKSQKCIFWNLFLWDEEHEKDYSWDDRLFSMVADKLLAGGFLPKQKASQGPTSFQPLYYMAAAIVATEETPGECFKIVDQVLSWMEESAEWYGADAMSNPMVLREIQDWLLLEEGESG